MIKDIQKAFRNRPRSATEERQKVRIILKQNGLIYDVTEFCGADAELKNGNLRAYIVNHIRKSVNECDEFSLEIIRQDPNFRHN